MAMDDHITKFLEQRYACSFESQKLHTYTPYTASQLAMAKFYR